MGKIGKKAAGYLRNMCLRPGLLLADEPPGETILIFAPHPDDEIIGCGGALIKHLKRGDKVKIIFLSANSFNNNEKEICGKRIKEARLVMDFLGVESYRFISHQELEIALKIEDNNLISSIVEEFSPDTIYLPSFLEEHSEHKKSAYLIARILKNKIGQTKNIKCILYQIWGKTCPNFLLNVSDVYSKSVSALQNYSSQLKNFNYIQMHKQLRDNWSYLGAEKKLYEAFYICSGIKLSGLISGRLNQVNYRGLLAIPYICALALRRGLRKRKA